MAVSEVALEPRGRVERHEGRVVQGPAAGGGLHGPPGFLVGNGHGGEAPQTTEKNESDRKLTAGRPARWLMVLRGGSAVRSGSKGLSAAHVEFQEKPGLGVTPVEQLP